MELSFGILGPIALLGAACLLPGDEPVAPTAAEPLAAQVIRKQARLREVVAELRSRPVDGMGPAARRSREQALALLATYADRGRFPVRERATKSASLDTPLSERSLFDVPLFVDERGTRCALASMLDGCGEQAVVERLASECNDAFVAELAEDPDVERCLAELGLTADEAAYIQMPPNRDGDIPVGHGGSTGDKGRGDTGGGRDTVPADTGAGNPGKGNLNGNAPAGTPSGASRPTTGGLNRAPTGGSGAPGRGAVTGVSRHRSDGPTFEWNDWWKANRDTFAHVRARYHAGVAVSTPNTTLRPDRPTAAQIRAELVPFFVELSHGEAPLRGDALAMWARAVDHEATRSEGTVHDRATIDDAAQILPAVLAFLADKNEPDRQWAPVMLAILGDRSACPALRELLLDTPAGRSLMTQTSPVPENVRALAAVAYGRSGGEIDALTSVLADSVAAHLDLAASAIVGLGFAAQHSDRSCAAVGALLTQLENDELPAVVRAQVPAALVLSGDNIAFTKVWEIVARFRGPRELRRAAALDLGQMAPELGGEVCDALVTLARRDVDAGGRQSAIIALGTLVARQGATAPADVIERLAAFHADALAGSFRHGEDLTWHALSAGLFAAGVPAHADAVVPSLRELVVSAASADVRAAACIALGLASDRASIPLLREQMKGGDRMVGRYAIEALGLLCAREARSELLDLCVTNPDEGLAYSAAVALGSMADPMLVEPMVAAFGQTRSSSVRAALARALGEIGDKRSIAGLRNLALDPTRDGPSREHAVGALGVLAQASDVAWNAPIKHALHPGGTTPSLALLLELF